MSHRLLEKSLISFILIFVFFLSACVDGKKTNLNTPIFEDYQPYRFFPTSGQNLFIGVTDNTMASFTFHFLGELVDYESKTGLSSLRCFTATFDEKCCESWTIEESLGREQYLLLIFEGEVDIKKIFNDSRCHDGIVLINRIFFVSPQTPEDMRRLCGMNRNIFEDYWSSEEYIRELIGKEDN
jgi:hypothetical protein